MLIPFVRAYLKKMDIEADGWRWICPWVCWPCRLLHGQNAVRTEITAYAFDIITIFPGFFAGIFEHGVVKRAIQGGLLKSRCMICGNSPMTGIVPSTTGLLAAARAWC